MQQHIVPCSGTTSAGALGRSMWILRPVWCRTMGGIWVCLRDNSGSWPAAQCLLAWRFGSNSYCAPECRDYVGLRRPSGKRSCETDNGLKRWLLRSIKLPSCGNKCFILMPSQELPVAQAVARMPVLRLPVSPQLCPSTSEGRRTAWGEDHLITAQKMCSLVGCENSS